MSCFDTFRVAGSGQVRSMGTVIIELTQLNFNWNCQLELAIFKTFIKISHLSYFPKMYNTFILSTETPKLAYSGLQTACFLWTEGSTAWPKHGYAKSPAKIGGPSLNKMLPTNRQKQMHTIVQKLLAIQNCLCQSF